MSNIWDSPVIIWGPKGMNSPTFPDFLSMIPTACLLSPSQFHSTPNIILGNYPWQLSHGPSISACWELHCNIGSTLTNGLLASLQRFWTCHMVSILIFSPWTPSVMSSHLQLRLSAVASPSLCSGGLQSCHSCSTWSLYDFKTSSIWETLPHCQVQLPTREAALAPVDHPEETLPRRLCVDD